MPIKLYPPPGISFDANNNIVVNNVLEGFTTTATAAATTTLTVASTPIQEFTGSTTQIVKLPMVSTLTVGQAFYIINNSSGVVTVNSKGNNLVQTMAANTAAIIKNVLITGTTAASWDSALVGAASGITTGTTTTTATTGSVLFADAGVVQQDNANFFWDDVNNFLRLSGAPQAKGLELTTSSVDSYYPVAIVFKGNGAYAGNLSSIESGFNGNVYISSNISGSTMDLGGTAGGVPAKFQVQGYGYETGGYAIKVFPRSTTTVGELIKLEAAQTANAFEVQPSGSTTPLMSIGPTGWVQDPGTTRVADDVANATASMANITGLSATLIAGRFYTGRMILFVQDATAVDGFKCDFDGGTATMTGFRAHGTIYDTALLLSTPTSAIATDFVAPTMTGVSKVEIDFGFTCNAAGTFQPRFAKNAVTALDATVFRESWMSIIDTA